MLTLASLTQPDFVKLARLGGTAQFLSVDFSHYVEFSRWCLQRKGKAFVEHAYAPGEHILPVLSVRVCGPEPHLSDSSRMVAVASQLSERALKKKGATAVPLLITPDGSVLRDSWGIAEHAGFDPVDPTLRRILDQELGPLARQLAYSYVLKESNATVCKKLFLLPASFIWKLLWHLGGCYFIKQKMVQSLRPNDAEAVAICRARLKETFSSLDNILKSKTTPYLAGDKPGAADFALAALASPVVSPQDYNLGKYDSLFVEIEKSDGDYLNEINYWRRTGVGKYCLMVYEKYRRDVEV